MTQAQERIVLKAFVCWNTFYGETVHAVYFGASRAQAHAAAAHTLIDCGLTRRQSFSGMRSRRAPQFDCIASYANRGLSPEKAAELAKVLEDKQ